MLPRVRRFQGTVTRAAAHAVALAAAFASVGASAEIAEARICEVSMHLDSAVTLGAFQLDLDYSGAGASIVAPGGLVACKGDVGNALTMFGHDAADAVVTVS